MKKTDIAWFAGIVDGEGTITAFHAPQTRDNGNRYERVYVCLQVVNSNKKIIDKIYRLAKCGYVHRHVYKNPRHLDQISWAIRGEKAMPLIEMLIPYLVGKKAQGLLALRWRELKSTSRAKLSKREQRKRDLFIKKIQKLNHPQKTSLARRKTASSFREVL